MPGTAAPGTPDVVAGLKPPWNHPHVMPCSLSKSPTFRPVIVMYDRAAAGAAGEGNVQSSNAGEGRGSPVTEPTPMASIAVTFPAAPPVRPERSGASIAPWVCTETRLTAPGVEGPNPVLNERSLIAKCCA